MKYPKKYLMYWIAGMIVSFIGIILARKTASGGVPMFAGYLMAFGGLSVIALGVSRKSKDEDVR